MDEYYLRENVQVEPLFDRWYAWSYLIPPATAARNITERHIKIMDSYVNAPQVHANAVKNPKLLGGPFIDYGGKRTDEIKALKEQTLAKRSDLCNLSRALNDLDGMLLARAKGYSLEPLYPAIPEILRGYVELGYDLNNQPSFRLVEPLIYRSKYYDKSAQSLMLSLTQQDDRPFVLSTPRLDPGEGVHLEVPFDNSVVNDLFRLKTHAKSWNEILHLLAEAGCRNDVRIKSFFTTQRPEPYQRYDGAGVRWRYFGHACILVETRGMSILFDPVVSYSYPANLRRYTYADLPQTIDYVVITHNHQDHLLFETLLQIRNKVKHVVVPRNSGGTLQDPSMKLLLDNTGFQSVIELGEFQQVNTEVGSILGLPFFGEHADLNVQSKLAYLVRIGKHNLLFAADSCNVEPFLYKHVHAAVGNADAIFLGMECDGAPLSWLYGPLMTRKVERSMDESRRLAGSHFEQAHDIVQRFGCREVYVYAMGQEPWLNYVMSIKYTTESRPITESNRLVNECRARGIQAERLFGEKEILCH